MRRIVRLASVLGAVALGLIVPGVALAACQKEPVIMWVSPGCYWCQVARVRFMQHQVTWVERDASLNGFRFTPVFWVDGVFITGYHKQKLSAELCISENEL